MFSCSKKIISGLPLDIEPIHFCEPSPKKIYYHYTSLEKMWLILEGESLRATQAGFSNDNQEISMGINVIQQICNDLDNTLVENDVKKFVENISRELLDSYIICFCKTDDKLSQWRAYCREGGVSLGVAFDDSDPEYYYHERQGFRRTATKCKLYPVFYYNYEARCADPDLITKDKLTAILKNKLNSIADNQAKKQAIIELIPYIKHCGFSEEEEHRLLINNQLDASMNNVVFESDDLVQYNDRNGQKSPYICIDFNSNSLEENPYIRIFADKKGYAEILKDIKKSVDFYNNTVKDSEKFLLDDKLIHIESEEPKIIIGQAKTKRQKLLFELVDRINNSKDSKEKIAIWCDGHLPIRSITVAPSLDQERIISMIKHFCTHKQFWMKYVAVAGSKIPYRS